MISRDVAVSESSNELVPVDYASNYVDEIMALSSEDFAGNTAKDRDVILFTLMRDMAGEVRALADKVQEIEDKARAMASPEGVKELTDKFLGGMGGGMFSGFLG